MTTINELLDELQLSSRIYGATLQGDIPSPDATAWQARKDADRSAVDAEIQRMQSRIAELEEALKAVLAAILAPNDDRSPSLKYAFELSHQTLKASQ